jgi:hypothetical protein
MCIRQQKEKPKKKTTKKEKQDTEKLDKDNNTERTDEVYVCVVKRF